jgi:hypothetical protein
LFRIVQSSRMLVTLVLSWNRSTLRDINIDVMRQTLYLHVGPAKTGTSAIQHFLRDGEDPTLFYPQVGQWADGSHHNLILNFSGNFSRPEVVKRDAVEMLEEIGAEARSSKKNIIISSEILAGQKNIGAFIEACKDVWKISPLAVKIIIVCREHFERASSLYNQRVKDSETLERESADQFLSERAHRLLYAPIIGRLEQTGAEVVAINYHPSATMLERFLAEIGFKNAPLTAQQPRNISLSIKGLVIYLALNRIACAGTEREVLRNSLGNVSGMFSPSEFIFGERSSHVAKKVFARDRKFLRSRFGLTFDPPRVREARSSFFIDDKQWDEIVRLAPRLGNKAGPFLEESAKFRCPK